jgi:hypothetical protein
VEHFSGYHSEWNLGSPGGWDYQRITQQIGKAVWQKIQQVSTLRINLDFDHPLLYPINGFKKMLIDTLYQREGRNTGFIAVVAEEETLQDVIENKNLAVQLDAIEGISSVLMAPQELTLRNGTVYWQEHKVSLIFMDFNTDVLLQLHKKLGLKPLLQAVRQNRVINPRGTQPINSKAVFEVVTDPDVNSIFHRETIKRTPWTRLFYQRTTTGPDGKTIKDLVAWTRLHWQEIVLKPEHGYSGKGVYVSDMGLTSDDSIEKALAGGAYGRYIVQEKIPFSLWAEQIPDLDRDNKKIVICSCQTDFRCLFGPEALFGFLGRYGGVPTNVGSGGGVQPLAVLKTGADIGQTIRQINAHLLKMNYGDLSDILAYQEQLAMKNQFTYLLGPIKIALRPRIITMAQMNSLAAYCRAVWHDCLLLEKMWLQGRLQDIITLPEEELDIVRAQPWNGSPAIFASDGLFSFGAHNACVSK